MINKTQKGYHKLILWEKFKNLLLITYQLTDKLPQSESFGLKSQMRRAMVSVVSNFVEGYLKTSKKDKNRFLEIAVASLMELEGQSEICLMLKYCTDKEYELFDKIRSEAGYFLYRYKISLKKNP